MGSESRPFVSLPCLLLSHIYLTKNLVRVFHYIPIGGRAHSKSLTAVLGPAQISTDSGFGRRCGEDTDVNT